MPSKNEHLYIISSKRKDTDQQKALVLLLQVNSELF